MKTWLVRFLCFIAPIALGAKPNFLVIVTDDQRPDTIGALGNPRIETPNLDWLVKHATDVLNKFQVERDRRTAYERLRGRPYRGEMLKLNSFIYPSQIKCKFFRPPY